MQLRATLEAALVGSLWATSAAAFGRFGQMIRDPFKMEQRSAKAEIMARAPERHHTDFRFLNKQTQDYGVEHLPDVPFDVGEMYAGSMPIDMKDPSRNLFFVFQPTIGDPVDEITIFLNGGPGCSSLESFFQETGLFTWEPGTLRPTVNEYSWVNLTNMLWVEQPVGTGFSQGKVTADSQEEIAQDFVHFFKNFQTTFGIKNFKIYVTGESYAGRYVPYVSSAILDENDKEHFDLRGALVYDPCIGQFDYVQEQVPTLPFVKQNANLFNFNDTFMQQLEEIHQKCGYQDFIDKYLQFPATEVMPTKMFNYTTDAECDIFDIAYNEALNKNPCFDIYKIQQPCPLLSDVMGFPTALVYLPDGGSVYFDRDDVKKAIHAPENVDWAECAVKPVFTGGDKGPQGEGDISANPTDKVLPKVIEATNRVLVSNGDFDMIIITNGTLMAIQNMTWGGHLGFQSAPSKPIDIQLPDLQWADVYKENGMPPAGGQGIMGIQHYERGLMWAQTFQAGHMQPEYQPRVTYRHLQWLLGHIETL